MLTITYDKVYSRFLSLVSAYDLKAKYESDADTTKLLLDEWLISIKSDPKCRKLFSSIILDETDRSITCVLSQSQGDDISDMDYIVELFGNGIAWKWVTPKYLSDLNAGIIITGREVQAASQANHMAQLEKMYIETKTAFYRLIKNYVYINNSYLKS